MNRALIALVAASSSLAHAGVNLTCYDAYFNEVRRLDAEKSRAQAVADKNSRQITKREIIGGLIGAAAGIVATGAIVNQMPDDPTGDQAAKTMVWMFGGTMIAGTTGGAGAWIGEKTTKDLSRKEQEIAHATAIRNRHDAMKQGMKVLYAADAVINRRGELSLPLLQQFSTLVTQFARAAGSDDPEATANRLLKGDASGALCRDGKTLDYAELVNWVKAH